MCSKANLFDTTFFALNSLNRKEKLFFFKNKISVIEAKHQLQIKSIKSQAAKIICFL